MLRIRFEVWETDFDVRGSIWARMLRGRTVLIV